MSFFPSFRKTAFDSQKEGVSPGKAFLGGTAAAGAYHIGKSIYYSGKERQAPNAKSVKHLQRSLKPGDIIIAGSHAKGSGNMQVRDMSPKVRKFLRAIGLSDSLPIYSNSTLLTSVGGGGKYHSGIYMGRGRVAHMTSNAGITTDSLKEFTKSQNIGAYRFGKGTGKEQSNALKFVKQNLKAKTQYQPASEFAMQGLSNMLSPVGKKPCRKVGKSMVCNTLPIRAYSNRNFGPQGEYTYSTDMRAAKGIKPVARMDKVKLPLTTKLTTHGGQVFKGLKWGVAAGAGALAFNKLFSNKNKGTNS